MAKKEKYYVVWEGVNPGVYASWAECQAQVKGYPQARYKSFPTKKEAEEAFREAFTDHIIRKKKEPKPKLPEGGGPVWKSISVDAACSGNPGVMEYQGVWTDTKDPIFYQGPFANGTNNIGEFLAIVHALALLKKRGNGSTIIYTDSRTAISWVKKKKANTKLAPGKNNAALFELIRRAENWLKANTFTNPIIKWETKIWGEIPADFGRK